MTKDSLSQANFHPFLATEVAFFHFGRLTKGLAIASPGYDAYIFMIYYWSDEVIINKG